jgi:Flp pilus assembly protein TadG
MAPWLQVLWVLKQDFRMRRLIHGERGQALVETAIVLPMLVLMLFGILDAGRIFSTWVVVTNASREGARYGAVGRTAPQIRTWTANAGAPVGVTTANVTVTCTPNPCPGPSGSTVSVQVSKGVTMITPVISAIFGSTFTVTNTAVMRLE